MIKTLSVACFTILTLFPSLAQDQDQMQELLDKALIININARLVSEDAKATWSFQAVKLTIPGKPVALQLQGKNINVNIVFTPYQMEEPNKILLVAQNQIMVQEAKTGSAKYFGNLKQIPVTLGEKIQFYPLGVNDTTSVNIQLEIEVIRYKDAITKQNQEIPDPDSLKDKSGEGGK